MSRILSTADEHRYTQMVQPHMWTIPYVIEKTGREERVYDIFSRLMKDRIVFIGTPIDDQVANVIVAQLLFLASDNPNQAIKVYVNSPGGSVTAGLAIYDTMQFVPCPIETTCLGQAASMGSVLLCAGSKGKRYALPHARIMIHQPWGGAQGTAADISIQAEEILRLKDSLYQILAKHCGQSKEKIIHDSDRDFFLSATAAKEYGLIDTVVESTKSVKPEGNTPPAAGN